MESSQKLYTYITYANQITYLQEKWIKKREKLLLEHFSA